MNASDFETIQIAVKRALANIGTKNGHACPSGGTNMDSLMHKLLVTNIGRSYFDAQYKSALKELSDEYEDEINDARIGVDTVLAVGSLYTFSLVKNTPAKRLDSKKFASELRKRGVSAEIIEAAQEAATVENQPAKKFSVTARV